MVSFVYFLKNFSRSKSSHPKAFCDKDVFKNFQNSIENICSRVSFLTMLQDIFKRGSRTGLFLLIFWKFLRTAMFCGTSTKICFSLEQLNFRLSSDYHFPLNKFSNSLQQKIFKNMVFSHSSARPWFFIPIWRGPNIFPIATLSSVN